MSRGTTVDDVDTATQHSPGQTHTSATNAGPPKHHATETSILLQPLVMQFNIVLQVLCPF